MNESFESNAAPGTQACEVRSCECAAASRTDTDDGHPLIRRVLMFALFSGGLMTLSFLGIIPGIPTFVWLACSAGAGVLAALFYRRTVVLKTAVVLLSCCSILAFADGLWRVCAPTSLYYRPDEMLLNHWPRMGSLARYSAGATYCSRSYGDLAAMAGRPEFREYRTIMFRSDSFGFPNASVSPEPVDVILLGDSFGAGSAISQAKTWGSLLGSRYHAAVYNLSIPDSGPWHELMDLKIELGRIKRREGAVVLWAIFSGNDLDDAFEDHMEPVLSESWLAQMRVSVASFRNRSPIRQLCQRAFAALQGERRPPIVRYLPDGRCILFRRGYAERARRTLADIQTHDNYPRLVQVFREMAQFAVCERLNVGVAALPSKEEVYGWVLSGTPYSDRDAQPSAFSGVVRQLCETYQMRFLDLKPPMVAEARRLLTEEGKLLWWSDDTHWNERGHAFAAATVYAGLLRPMLLVR